MLSATFSTYAAKAGKVISRDSARTKSAASKKAESRSLEITVSLAHNQTASDNPYTFGAKAFKDKLEQVSGGGATATLYNGTMSEDEGELFKKLVEDARSDNKKIKGTCSYVHKKLESSEFDDIRA